MTMLLGLAGAKQAWFWGVAGAITLAVLVVNVLVLLAVHLLRVRRYFRRRRARAFYARCEGILAEFDDRIDALEDAIFVKADDTQLQEIFQMKRLLVGMRKAVTPERDAFATLLGGVDEIPGLTEDDERYFRDIYDHLIRISDLIDSYRDLLTGAMDVYLSTVSNRLNTVMKQLAIIATIFLPLSWLTGFFGQNFGWEVRHITGWGAFVVFGLLVEVVAVLGLLIMFKKRGWFS